MEKAQAEDNTPCREGKGHGRQTICTPVANHNAELIANLKTQDEAAQKLLDTYVSLDDFLGQAIEQRQLRDDVQGMIAQTTDLSGSYEDVEERLKASRLPAPGLSGLMVLLWGTLTHVVGRAT